MGGWQLEVFKMSLYMLFPVGVFIYFNQPQYFEEWVVKTRREIYPPEHLQHRQELQEFIKKYKEKKAKELQEKLEQVK